MTRVQAWSSERPIMAWAAVLACATVLPSRLSVPHDKVKIDSGCAELGTRYFMG
jgi:hypothetical protein